MIIELFLALLIGDSIAGQCAPFVPPRLMRVHAYSGSGLSNRTIHDWTREELPNGPTIVILGTNDAQSIPPHHFGTAAWEAEYRVRLQGLMGQSKPMLWVLPARTGSKSLDSRLDRIRRIQIDEAKQQGVETLDLRVLLDEQAAPNPKLHSADHIHLNGTGIKRLVRAMEQWIAANKTFQLRTPQIDSIIH
jgi:hypothetical protein